MKALFLIFHGFADYNGISKKIFYQVDALRNCGVDTCLCYLNIDDNGHHKRMIDNKVLEDYGTGIFAKIKKRACYSKLTEYILNNKIDFLYIRSVHNSNPFINRMVRKLHENGVKIVMEIPTYPYEGQFKDASLKDRVRLRLDIMCRGTMAKYLDRIVTFTDYPQIFGVPTISISNGIDFNKTPVKHRTNNTSRVINLIGVAEIHYWHGFDRLIEGLAEYYKTEHTQDVIFNIVGEGVATEVARLNGLTVKYGLEDKVIFHGTRSGDALDELFESSDMGIASLARHRSGNTKIKTLKNREYAARGIAFIYSEMDDDFDNMPYVMKVPANEDAINIASVVEFYNNNTLTPQQIRDTIIDKLSWTTQMEQVINQTLD